MIIKSSKPISAFDFYHHYEFQRELIWNLGLPSCFSGKESTCNTGDVVLIPRLGRSPGEGNGNPHEYSCLANPMDRGVWQATIHGVKKELDMTSWLNNSNNNLDSQFSSVAQSCTILCHPKDWSTPLPCPSPNPRACSNSCLSSQWCHPNHLILSSPSPPAFSLSQHQGLFKWVNSSQQVAKVLEFQIQHQFFQWKFRTDIL